MILLIVNIHAIQLLMVLLGTVPFTTSEPEFQICRQYQSDLESEDILFCSVQMNDERFPYKAPTVSSEGGERYPPGTHPNRHQTSLDRQWKMSFLAPKVSPTPIRPTETIRSGCRPNGSMTCQAF